MSSRKIGEHLIERGLLTPGQLENALKAQLIFGGHLGTILLEMGFVSEPVLGEALAEVSGAPYAPPELLDSIPDPVIRLVPTRLAEEFQLVPLGTKDKTLHVAMVNPRDLNAHDALNFALNLKIVPWIAPEARVMQAMEKYYGIPRRLRFIANSVGGEQKDATLPVLDAPAGQHGEGGEEAAGDLLDLGAEYGYGRNWTEIAESLDEPALDTQAEPSPSPNANEIRTLARLAEALCRADERPQTADPLVRFAAGRMPRCLLMGVRGETATAWSAHGMKPPSKWTYPITSDGILRLLGGESSFSGPLPRDDRFLPFYKSLKLDPPAELILVPIHLNDRLVAIFYGDGGSGGAMKQRAGEIFPALRMFTMALSLILLKRRIRSVEDLTRESAPARRDADSDCPPPSRRRGAGDDPPAFS